MLAEEKKKNLAADQLNQELVEQIMILENNALNPQSNYN